MVTAWDYNPGRIGDDKTQKTICLMQLVRGMDWEAVSLCSQLEFNDKSNRIQELRPKV